MATTADIFYPETSNADSLESNKGRQKNGAAALEKLTLLEKQERSFQDVFLVSIKRVVLL